MPVIRQASRMRTVIGSLTGSVMGGVRLTSSRRVGARPSLKSACDLNHEAVEPLPTEQGRCLIERRLMRRQRELMRNEQLEHFGDVIDTALDPVSRTRLPVQPRSKSLVEFVTGLAV